MRATAFITAFALGMATSSLAAPTAEVDLSPLNFPADSLASMMESAGDMTCPSTNESCGVVTFTSGQYVSFGQGICMQLGKNLQSIYVAKCYCSLWNTCTGNSSRDIYVDGMMMCERPKMMDQFDKEVKYLSCGGMH